MLYDGKTNVIGNGAQCNAAVRINRSRPVHRAGVVVDIPILLSEMDKLEKAGMKPFDGRLKISDRAQLLFNCHKVSYSM